jgi:hypothetical protein
MRRVLAPILAPRWIIAEMSAAVVIVIIDLCLTHTMHVLKLGPVAIIQYGGRFVAGGWGHALPSVSLMTIKIILALPGFAWGIWFLCQLDSPRKPAQ